MNVNDEKPCSYDSSHNCRYRLTKRNDERKMLVLINPHSGCGKSLNIFKKMVEPHLLKNNQNFEVFITQIDYRVKDKLASMTKKELTDLRSFVVVSGDGLVYELVNTIMKRDDYRELLRLPISVIPTGSGNGLAYTLIRRRHPHMRSTKEAIELCCKQTLQPMVTHSDIIRISYGQDELKPNRYWSFLSVGWGLLADIDIDSEWLRRIGSFRFTFYGLLRSLTSVSYRGTLSYKRKPQYNIVEEKEDIDEDWTYIEDQFACLYAVYQTHISSNTEFSPRSTMTDQTIYLTIVRGKLNPKRVIEFLLAIDDGSHERLPYVQVIPVSTFKFQPLESSKVVVDGEKVPWKVDDGMITVDIIPERLALQWNFDE